MNPKKEVTAAIIATLGAFAFTSNVAAEQKLQKLTGAQIQAKFPGMELTDEAHWGEVFERNGTLTITSMGHKSSGKWRIQKDQLCLETGSEPRANSRSIAASFSSRSIRRRTGSSPKCWSTIGPVRSQKLSQSQDPRTWQLPNHEARPWPRRRHL